MTHGHPTARLLKSTISGDEVTIKELVELYPTACYNHGSLAKQTQKYYMCTKLLGSEPKREAFRVT